ncbi:MAG: hypothetical protein J1F64_11545 [Oscillospiraceae bacterium]|nr:hypothetical protein [Oscillospiraceae bacterium]
MKPEPVYTTQYTDFKSKIHKVKHSVVFSEETKKNKIIDDIYRVFENKN